MNPTNFVTPEQAKAKGDKRPIEELEALANSGDIPCSVCGNPSWRYAGLQMCFPCTTGESDASNDMEIIPRPA